MLAKISKIARFILLVLFFTVGFLYVVFRSKPVQTWIAQKASAYLSGELGTKVKVGGVDIDFFKTAVFENLYIEDLHHDTMFYFRRFKVDYNTYDKELRHVRFNYVKLEGGKILFGEHEGDSVGNYEFFIDFFKGGPRDPSKPKLVWTIFSKDIEIENVRFDYFNRNEPKPDNMDFNYNDMSYRHITGELEDFYMIDDSLHFKTSHLEMIEKCGFKVNHLSADTKIHEGGIELHDMRVLTPNSDISDMFVMETHDWKDYSDFNEKVRMKVNLLNARIGSKDLAYFSNYLKQYNTEIFATGIAEGYLGRLKGKNTTLKLFDNTMYKGDWTLTGLPDFDNTVLDFEVEEFVTDYHDLNAISLNSIPANFAALGKIRYKGKFSGFYNDFITYGHIQTNLGSFESDMNIKFKQGLDSAVYSGKLKTGKFMLRELFAGSDLDEVAFDLDIKGKGLSTKSFDVTLNGDIHQLKYRNYTYKNIQTTSRLKPGYFTGKATIRDENLNVDFNGELRADKGKIPEMNLKADIANVNLAVLGLDTTRQDIKGNFTLNFTGHSLDDVNGLIKGTDVVVTRNGSTVVIPAFSITASGTGKNRQLSLRSDIVDADINGQISVDKIDVSIMHMMHQLIPAFFAKPSKELPHEDFAFEFDLKDPEPLTSLYMPDLKLEPCKGYGFYRSAHQELELVLSNDEIRYKDYVIKDLSLNATKKADTKLQVDIHLDEYTDNSALHSNDIKIKGSVYDNFIDYDISGVDTGYKLDLASEGQVMFGKDSILLRLSKARMNIDNEHWRLDTNATVLYTAGKYKFDNLKLSNGGQNISLDGEYGNNSINKIDLSVAEFQLAVVNYFTGKGSIPQLGGEANGNLTFKAVEGQALYESNFNITRFRIGNDTVGDLKVVTTNKSGTSIQHLEISILDGSMDSLSVVGDIDYKSKSNNLNLVAKLPPTPIRVFEPFVAGIMSHMSGQVYSRGDVIIKGSFAEPEVKGHLEIQNAEVVIDYLKIPVRFSTSVELEKNRITLHKCTIYDDRGQSGQASGFVKHNSFSDFALDLRMTGLNNFHVLNTNHVDNSLYYGQAYASGNASFVGPFDALDIDINAKTNRNTFIYLPISQGDAIGLPNYIHFKTARKKVSKENEESSIHSLVMDIEATKDAEIQIIFDETIGDKIKGTGSGNIRMEMNQSGDFYMFGTYVVNEGQYLFTKFDLYNKRFYVRPGGTITWHGDPLDAKLNLVAFNIEKADPTPLLTAVATASTTTSNTPKLPITAESELYIKGNLFSPEISFGLKFPYLQSEAGSSTASLTSVINRIKSDKEEVSRQVFSLLMMRKFLPPSFAQSSLGLENAGSDVASTAGSDLLSAQLSNWLDKIDPKWKVNVIYRNGTATLPTEYGAQLSSRFINENLSVSGSWTNYYNRPNINIEYKITSAGNVRIKAYQRQNFNQVNTATLASPITTTGLGFVYTTEFNRWFGRKHRVIDPPAPKEIDSLQRDTTGVTHSDSLKRRQQVLNNSGKHEPVNNTSDSTTGWIRFRQKQAIKP